MPCSFRKTSLLLSSALVAAGLLAILPACKPPADQGVSRKPDESGQSGAPRPDRPFLTPVVAMEVKRGEILATVAATGTVVPVRSRLLQTEEAGRLHFARDWQEGDFVERGTLIARIESETLDADYARAEADLELQRQSLSISRRSMEAAVRDYEITQELYSRGIVARKNVEDVQLQMEQRINSYRQAEINLQKSKASLETLKARRERLQIAAPFDGLLVARATLDGSKPFATTFGTETITDYDGRLVSNGYSVCGLIDTSRVLLRSDVTGRDIGPVRLGQEAHATVYSTHDLVVTGTVAEIGKAVNQDTAAFRVDILIDNPDLELKPGMFARVDVVTERRRATISVAKEYIRRRNNRDVVFVVEDSPDEDYQIVREVPVETGLEGRDEIEVTWGLQEGSLLVVRGFEVLQDKTPVSVLRPDIPIRPEEVEPEPPPGQETVAGGDGAVSG